MSNLKIFIILFLCQALLSARDNKTLQKSTDFNVHFSLVDLTVSDGLYENNINDVLQDSYGFLWLAGMSGLQKYDGYTFKYYKPDSVNPAWQEAERLFEDSKKNLWVNLAGGLARYQKETDSFSKYHFINEKNDTVYYGISSIAEDRDGAVWVWSWTKGLFKVDTLKNSFIPNEKVNEKLKGLLDGVVRCLVFDRQNNLWLGTNRQGLFLINPQKETIKNYQANPDSIGSISHNLIRNALCDAHGDLWFGTQRGLNRYDGGKDVFESFYIDQANPGHEINMIRRMADDGLGNIWTVTSTVSLYAIGRFNKKSRKFYFDSKLKEWPNSITVDRSGILWFGNNYQGIIKLDPDAQKFSTFTIKKEDTDLLKDKGIGSVFKDSNGDIWFGVTTADGLYRFNPQSGKYRIYRLNRTTADSHNSNFITTIFQDSKGTLWIGTKSGLIRFDRKGGQFRLINPVNTIYAGTGRTANIVEDAQGKLWLITINGMLIHFDPQSEKMEFFSVPDSKLSFRAIEMDPGGFLWIGSLNNGLFKFDISDKNFLSVKKIADKNISALHLQADSILWCATNADGLLRYNTFTKSLTTITEADGLLSNGLLGMEQDKSGNLWLSSHRGLIRYNSREQIFKNYFKEDGFLTNEFHYRGHYQDKNGQMIFGSSHGLVTFYPESIKNSDYRAPLIITDIKINNQKVTPGGNSPLKKNISFSKEIILSHEQNDLSITFSSLDFSHPQRNEYTFYLENLEENWRPAGRERTAYYTNLDPGEYVFRVKGSNSDGLWNEAGTSINITILPPWWQTSFAYIMYFLLIFGILYGLRRYELNRQKLKHNWQLQQLEAEKFREIDHLKSRFFANISHEFRTPLTLIKGPVQQMLSGEFKGNIKKQYQMILRNSNRLLKLINQLLDLSRLDSGQMTLRASVQDIIPLLKGLTHSFESLAKQKNIDLIFKSCVNDIELYVDRDKFEKIILNLLSNAFKFTPEGGIVRVEVLKEQPPQSPFSKGEKNDLPPIKRGQRGVLIKITNSGSFIPTEQLNKIFDRFYQTDDSLQRGKEGTGIGLALTKELTELHHGTISVKSHHQEGTTFTIQLPLGRDHLQKDEIVQDLTARAKHLDQEIINEAINLHEDASLQLISVKSAPLLLIVEDNPDMRSYMVSCLENEFKISKAEDGAKGFESAIKQLPDIIISDVMMPGMDGFQFCSKIKTDQRTSHIPVILLTAKASADSKIEGLETGADDYLTKPFDKRELLVRLNNLIEQRRNLHEKFKHDITAQFSDITVTSIDEQLLQKALKTVEKHISDPDFDTTTFAKEVGMSRMLLNTKIKVLTGQTSGEFIRTLRLKRAAKLLQKNAGNVSEVAYEVGFQNLSYFSKVFREQFGLTPSQFVQE